MKCMNCGTEIRPGSAFCPHCGNQATPTANAYAAPAAPMAHPSAAIPPAGKSPQTFSRANYLSQGHLANKGAKRNPLLFVGCGVAAVALVTILAFGGIFSGNAGSTSTAASTETTQSTTTNTTSATTNASNSSAYTQSTTISSDKDAIGISIQNASVTKSGSGYNVDAKVYNDSSSYAYKNLKVKITLTNALGQTVCTATETVSPTSGDTIKPNGSGYIKTYVSYSGSATSANIKVIGGTRLSK